MKLSQFLGLSKTKPNLTPAISRPTLEELSDTKALREYAMGRIGDKAGFGEGFLSKTANPVIASREARFKEQELPQISNQLSSRGVARSAGTGLATDMINRAEQNKQRDVDELMSKFYYLNEQQKKTDNSEGAGILGNMQRLDATLRGEQAAQSERQVGIDKRYTDSINTPVFDLPKLLSTMAGNAIVPGAGTFATTGKVGSGASPLVGGSTGGKSGAKQTILGSTDSGSLLSMSDEDYIKLIQSYFGGSI